MFLKFHHKPPLLRNVTPPPRPPGGTCQASHASHDASVVFYTPHQTGLQSIRYAPGARSIQSVWMVTDFETNRARDVTMRRA